mgnify:CR=1 FL=1
MVVYVLNSLPISALDTPCQLDIEEVIEEGVKEFLSIFPFVSAVGRKSTADFMSRLLGVRIPAIRREIILRSGDIAIVFQLMERLPEGKILTEEELRKIPYKFFKVEVI